MNSEEFFIRNIIRMIKSRKSKWVETVTRIADMRNLQDFCVEILMEDSYNKTNERHKFLKFIFWNRTLRVSDSISVHHQESSTVCTAIGVGHTGYAECLLGGSVPS